MEEIHLNNWSAFEDWLASLNELREQMRIESPHKGYVSKPIYRGQSNSSWSLQTSLERYFPEPVKLSTYARMIGAIKPSIESQSDDRWEFPSYHDIVSEEGEHHPHLNKMFQGQAYEFLLYLRHNGFPSPLLDWSASPYVAAFFAYSDAREDEDHVAIYSFIEYTGLAKSGTASQANVHELGPYTRAHQRHFLQQSRYTVCVQNLEGQTFFSQHEEAFMRSSTEQDRLWKIYLPTRDKKSILRRLDLHNINSYSLFASDEALMKMLAFRHFDDFAQRGLLPDKRFKTDVD